MKDISLERKGTNMTTVKKIRNRFGNYICRGCINEVYHANLFPRECEYEMYPDMCPRCKQMKNIVCGTSVKGTLKLLIKSDSGKMPLYEKNAC